MNPVLPLITRAMVQKAIAIKKAADKNGLEGLRESLKHLSLCTITVEKGKKMR